MGMNLDRTTLHDEPRAATFRALHAAAGSFVIANAWDGGSARILEAHGFPALATSSAACAATLGRVDGHVTRDEVLAHIRLIAGATSLPVSADLEKGFADDPEGVASTIRLAAEAGAVGGSIEDSTGHGDIFDLDLAVERIAAASAAARALPMPFTLTARCENHLHGRDDLDDTIRRLQAYEAAGADVLFAPGLADIAAVRRVCGAVTRPVNFMVGIVGRSFSVAELTAAGVKRISLAGSLYRSAMGALVEAAREVRERGSFDYLQRAVTTRQFNDFLKGK
jgi:2-methylisocitrate lyase-like PEP mutase family enzyme